MIHTFLIKDIIVKIPKEQIEAYIAKKRNEKKERLAYIKATANKHAPFLGDLKNCVENALDEITSKSLDEYISSINEDAEPSELIDETELLKDVEILNNGLDFLNGLDFITFEEHLRPTAEQMKRGLDDGWGWKQVLKGYDVFDNSDNFVWAEVEFSKDKNYQEEAHKNGINSNGNYVHALAGMNIVPQDGYYRYRTNPDPNTPEWNISGKMKVVRVLSRYEVDKILKENGKEPPLHEEDYLQKVNQKLDRLINKSATVKVNGEEHHCDGLLKGYAESIDENNKLQTKIIGLEKSYKTLSNLYQSKNKKEITVEVDREEI